ncbi:MAG: glycosyltransferase family 2 protein [Oscillospiraceae bacterium]|nr:glycosyltransferase family 2 protein [Oscillospiraceae bacterium]
MGKIYFFTVAFNAEKTLKRCVESVLNQTEYGDRIEYWFCDNGSTDRTRDMIDEYAKKDPRIRVFYNEKNMEWNEQSSVFWDLPELLEEDDYFCVLDSDDFYDTDFLAKTIPFIQENKLDIALVGSVFFDENTGYILGKRQMEETMIVDTPEKFEEYFSHYHKFTRTTWGKVFPGRVANHMVTSGHPDETSKSLLYGIDTYSVFSVLEYCNRIGILSGTLHKYQISKKSASYQWMTGRFESDQILNETAEDFLKKFGPISRHNREFLDAVFANALSDSVNVLFNAHGITNEEKLKELRKAVDYRVTSDMTATADTAVLNARQDIFNAALEFGKDLKEENDDLKAALKLISPKCAPYISVDDIGLYARDDALKNALYNDNMPELVEQLLRLISKNSYSKQFDLRKIVNKFSQGRGLAAEITDPKFLKKHGDIFLLIWKNEYARALDKMTDIVLNDKSLNEAFYQVYLSLAAILECVDEFLIGKIKLAVYYCRHDQTEECRAVLSELEEMGVQDNDDILEIKAKLNAN